jgi:hypothetical protein
MPELAIAPEKVAFIILKAREFGAKVAAFDEGDTETADEQDGADGVLENRTNDPDLQELVAFIGGLDVDEKINLVALAWVGRGTFDLDDWDEALTTANDEASVSTARYLVGMPLLPDYLEEGLAAFGVDIAEVESDVAG